jgi:hypothetical protein
LGLKTNIQPQRAMKNKNKSPKTTPPEEEKNDFPGYPLYPASEDITNRAKRALIDPENPVQPGVVPMNNLNSLPGEIDGKEDESTPKTEFDVTSEDLEALGPKDLSMDMGDDETLKHRSTPIDFSGDDLDVPGSEDDDVAEAAGSEDEENNSYSIGGDRHNDLEEDHA